MKDEKKDGGRDTFFEVEREEVGRIKLADGVDLTVFMAGEHLDMRLGVNRRPYTGLSYYLPGRAYQELKKLIDRVDKIYQERLELSGIPEGAGAVARGRPRQEGYVTSTI